MVSFLIAFAGLSLSNAANWLYAFGSPLLQSLDPKLLGLDFLDPQSGVLGPALLYSHLAGGVGWLFLGVHTWLASRLPRWVSLVMIVLMLLGSFQTAFFFLEKACRRDLRILVALTGLCSKSMALES